MTKKKNRKIILRLDRQTLRILTAGDLGGAHGGCDTPSLTTEVPTSAPKSCLTCP